MIPVVIVDLSRCGADRLAGNPDRPGKDVLGPRPAPRRVAGRNALKELSDIDMRHPAAALFHTPSIAVVDELGRPAGARMVHEAILIIIGENIRVPHRHIPIGIVAHREGASRVGDGMSVIGIAVGVVG